MIFTSSTTKVSIAAFMRSAIAALLLASAPASGATGSVTMVVRDYKDNRIVPGTVLSLMTNGGICRKRGPYSGGESITCGGSDDVFPSNAFVSLDVSPPLRFGENPTGTGWPDSVRLDGAQPIAQIERIEQKTFAGDGVTVESSTVIDWFELNGNTCGSGKWNNGAVRNCVTLEVGKLYRMVRAYRHGTYNKNVMVFATWDGVVEYIDYGVSVDIDSCDYAWNEDLERCAGVPNLGRYTARRLRGVETREEVIGDGNTETITVVANDP